MRILYTCVMWYQKNSINTKRHKASALRLCSCSSYVAARVARNGACLLARFAASTLRVQGFYRGLPHFIWAQPAYTGLALAMASNPVPDFCGLVLVNPGLPPAAAPLPLAPVSFGLRITASVFAALPLIPLPSRSYKVLPPHSPVAARCLPMSGCAHPSLGKSPVPDRCAPAVPRRR